MAVSGAGMLFGCFGPLVLILVLRTQDLFQRIHGGNIKNGWLLRRINRRGFRGLLGADVLVRGGRWLILRSLSPLPVTSARTAAGLILLPAWCTLICSLPARTGGIRAYVVASARCWVTAFCMAAIPLFTGLLIDASTFDCRYGGRCSPP